MEVLFDQLQVSLIFFSSDRLLHRDQARDRYHRDPVHQLDRLIQPVFVHFYIAADPEPSGAVWFYLIQESVFLQPVRQF